MSMISLPSGLHPGIPAHLYHVREGGIASKSCLDLVNRSPAHYKAWLDGGAEEEESPALFFGSAFHCALLEPDRFKTEYVTEPEFGDCRKTANKTARDAWRAENEHAKRLTDEDRARIAGMISSVRAHPLAGRMLRDGEAELSLRWTDPETGLPCKARTDYYVRSLSMIADFKSAADASKDAFRKAIANHRYHVQDAMYRAGFAALGEPVQHFVFIAVEKEPPYAVATYFLDGKARASGLRLLTADLATLAQCLQSKHFPGYPETLQELDLPPWAA